MATIRVLLIDDHAIVRSGVRTLLSLDPGIEVVGEASTGEEGVQLAGELRPDVILMDLRLGSGMSGMDAIREVKKTEPETNVLALTMVDNEEYFGPVLEAGASGYLLKESEPHELISAVRAVAAGGAFLSPAVARVVLGGHVRGERGTGHPLSGLTASQRRVIELAALGNTNREIAKQLSFSPKTVEKYRAAAMRKLGLHTRADLIKFALAKGILSSTASSQSS